MLAGSEHRLLTAVIELRGVLCIMGVVDQIFAAALESDQASGANHPLASVHMVMRIINNYPHQVRGVIDALRAGGFGSQLDAWMACDHDVRISRDGLITALGARHIAPVAHRYGMDAEQAADSLAELLPEILCRLTGEAQNEPGGMQAVFDQLRARLPSEPEH